MIKYKNLITLLSIEEYLIHQLTTNKWVGSIFSPDRDPLFSDRNDESRFYLQDDPFGDDEEIHLIDLHPTADAEIETPSSILILSCFAQYHYISLSVESKEFFLKSFGIRIYYENMLQLQDALVIVIEYQYLISTENYVGFIGRLLDVNLKVFWQSGLVLGEEVTRANLLNGHPEMEMNW